jgi:DNA polymerase III alpha subunit (gram-positive type)
MRCPRCKVSQLVEISVHMAGRDVTMRSCSRCDTRWWDSEGERLELPGVLALASRR